MLINIVISYVLFLLSLIYEQYLINTYTKVRKKQRFMQINAKFKPTVEMQNKIR